MINIYYLPKTLISKIFLYLENPEAKLIKKFRGYNDDKYSMFSYLKYNRDHLPFNVWLNRYNLTSCYDIKSVSRYNLETYNDYEDLWEIIDELSIDSDFELDSI